MLEVTLSNVLWAVLALSVVSFLWALLVKPSQPEQYTVIDTPKTPPKEDTIFVSIPAYRDQDCVNTVVEMFEKADKPHRIFAGMCVQTVGDDGESCLPKNFKWHSNVRVIRIPHTEARGPTYARALCAQLYRNETWFLGIDSHSKWVKGWDDKCLRMVRKLPAKSVLSHYPPAWDETDVKDIPHCHKVKFDTQGAPALESTRVPADGKFRKTPYVTGGFTFGPGTIASDVKFDPTLDHLWIPEEFLLSARLYTHGYNVYSPTETIVTHFYERKGAARWHDDIPSWNAIQKDTLKRVLKLLDPTAGASGYGYGMGTSRTLQQYYDYCGIDWHARGMIPGRENDFAR